MKNQKKKSAFTLVELMVVIAIIGILATVVVLNFAGTTYKARKVRVKADLAEIFKALKLYKMDMGKYPEKLEYLVSAPPDDPGGNWIQYIEGRIPTDPWYKEYFYTPGEGASGSVPFELGSYGADGQPGGEGDDEDLTYSRLILGETSDAP